MPPIENDGALLDQYSDELNEDSFAAAFMGSEPEDGDDAEDLQPSNNKRKPKTTDEANDEDEDDADEASEETLETEGEDDEDGEDNEDDAPAKKFADDSDDTYVKVKVGDEVHEVKVKDLQRLYGQEASLTRKSQAVADEQKAVDTKRAENIAAYDVLLKRTTERANAYRALPWTQMMKDPNVPPDQLEALQAEASKAIEEETFLKSELGNFMQKVTAEQTTARRTAAQDCLKAINNPESPAHIKGWNDALYNDLRAFGAEMGIPEGTVNEITDAGAIKILHMAMQFHRGAKKVVVTKKVNKTPTKIVKNSASSPATRGTNATVTRNTAVKKAARTGSMQDAANAFEAMMGDD